MKLLYQIDNKSKKKEMIFLKNFLVVAKISYTRRKSKDNGGIFMLNPEKEREICTRPREGVINYDEDAVKEAANEALEIGMDAKEAVFGGLVPHA